MVFSLWTNTTGECPLWVSTILVTGSAIAAMPYNVDTTATEASSKSASRRTGVYRRARANLQRELPNFAKEASKIYLWFAYYDFPLFVKTETKVTIFVDALAVCLAEVGLGVNPVNTKHKANLRPSCIHPAMLFWICLPGIIPTVRMHVVSGPNCQSCPRCGTWNCCEPMLFVRQVSLALRLRCFDSVCSLHCTWYNRDLQYVDVVCRGCFDLLWVRLLGLIGPPAVARNFVRAQ